MPIGPAFPRIYPAPENAWECRPHVAVLLVGRWDRQEFALALQGVAESQDWQHVVDLASAREAIDAYAAPTDLILVAQSTPGSLCPEELNALQAAAPLSRIVVVAGTWCEGELRTGQAPTGTLRLYWYELAPWWRFACQQLDAGAAPPWSAPLDTPRSGRLIFDRVPSGRQMPSMIAVVADDISVYETLSAAVRQHGIATVHRRSSESGKLPCDVEAGIFDAGQFDDREVTELAHFCSSFEFPAAGVVALLDFPRRDHVARARQAGARAILAKPYVVAELVDALQSLDRIATSR